MKKWYFNLKNENFLAKNDQTLSFLFYQVRQTIFKLKFNLIFQAVEDLERGIIRIPDNFEIDINFLRENHRYLDFLKHVHKFGGYGELVFPHCPCDSRKNGHVIATLSFNCFQLKACSNEGELEPNKIVEFQYEDFVNIDVDNEEMAFVFETKIANKPNKTIKIYTGFVNDY